MRWGEMVKTDQVDGYSGGSGRRSVAGYDGLLRDIVANVAAVR